MSQGVVEQSQKKSFVAHAKVIGILTLVSRFFGVARAALSVHFFGAGLVSSAFTFAFTVPNLFRKLLGEGALSSAFIPLYAQAVKADSPEEARSFAASSVKLLTLILLGITLVGELILAGWYFGDPKMLPDRRLTLQLTMIMLPYVIMVCGTAFLGGILQVHRRFAVPAMTPIVLNAIHIGVIIVGGTMLHLRTAQGIDLIERQTRLAFVLSFLVLVAGVLQVWMLAPGLRAVGFRMRGGDALWSPKIKKMLLLTIPVAMGAGVLQLSVLIDKSISVGLAQGYDANGNLVTHFTLFGKSIAYPMAAGAVPRLDCAQLLYQFPLGVFAAAIATAIFPSLSTDALDKSKEKFKASLRQGIEFTMLEGLAASAGLIIVRYPTIRLLFQHGHFTPFDTEWVARSTAVYASAIWAFSLLQVISRAFYAMHDTKTPLVLSMVTIVVNTVVEVPLLWVMGESGMAAGTVVSFALQAVVMLWILDRRVEGLGISKLMPNVLKMMVATAAMCAMCYLVRRVPGFPNGASRLQSLAQLVLMVFVGGATYLIACGLMGIDAVKQLRPKKRVA